MRKRRKTAVLLAGIIACLILPACGNSGSNMPDLSALGAVNAIAREDGSGTKAEFEAMLKTSEDGVNAVATSTDEVEKLVAEDVSAVGYLAYSSSLAEDTIKTIQVDGREPSADNIRKGKYPLCRKYYLAYSGSLSALQQDFLSYVTSAGQQIVDENCVSVNDASTFLSDRSTGKLTITGSTSAAALIGKLASDYKNYNPDAEIEVTATDSSQGLTAAIRGECDFAISSRELRDYERELLTAQAFAKDGIAIVVNRDNPVESLSSKQIRTIYDGDCKKWDDL